MYFDYIKEREGRGHVKSSYGFMTYKILGDEMHIHDIYVTPESRKKGECWNLFFELLEIAKQEKCKFMIGQVVPSTNGANESLLVILSAGFKLFKSTEDRIILVKEL